MNKILRVCSTEDEIVSRMLKWHPHLDDFKMLGNNGSDYVLAFTDISEEDFYDAVKVCRIVRQQEKK